MKRTSVMITLLAWLLVIPVLAQGAPVGKFTRIEGNVDVTSPGKEAVQAHPGGELQVGDVIRTKNGAKCDVTFPDGSVLRLAEKSRLRVAGFRMDQGRRQAVFELSRGKVQNIVKAGSSEGSSYEVRTPTAAYRSQEADFFVYYQSGISGGLVTAGRVEAFSLSRPDDVRSIGPGQVLVVTDAQAVPQVRTATAMETAQLQREMDKGTAGTPGPAESLALSAVLDPVRGPEVPSTPSLINIQLPSLPDQPLVLPKTDTTPPEITLTGLPAAVTNVTSAAIVATASEAVTWNFTLDGVAQSSANLANLSDGNHTFVAIATNGAGIKATQIHIFTVDTVAPAVITAAPPALTNNPPATLTLSETATINFTLDGVSGTTTGASLTLPTADGQHTLTLSATDTAGNASPAASYTWTVDTAPPVVALAGTPAPVTNVNRATIGVTPSEAATLTYTLDGVSVTSPDLTNLAEGSHTFTVTATDPAGNVSTQAYTWVTDYTPPVIGLTSRTRTRDDDAADLEVELAGNETVVFTSDLDGGGPVSGSSLNLTELTPGEHTLTVEATDPAGNTTTQTLTFTLENYLLAGDLAGAGLSGSVAGSMVAITGQDWQGTWNMDLTGDAAALPGANWQAVAGGQLAGTENIGYWLADMGGNAWTGGEVKGDVNYRYLTPYALGESNSPLTGSYQFDQATSGYAWQAAAAGETVETPLQFSAFLDAGYHQYENNSVNYTDLVSGLLGTTVSPFASATALNVPGDPVDLYMMGEAWTTGQTAWWGSLYETQAASGDLLPDGFILGRTTAGNAAGETLTGSLVSLYIDEAGNAGLLEGNFDGLYHPLGNGKGLFEATSGLAWATKKAEGYTDYDPALNLGWNPLDGTFGGSFLDGNNQPTGAILAGGTIADISWGRTGSYATWLQKGPDAPEPWGIFNMELGGQYLGTPADTWTMQLGGSSFRALGSREYWLAEVFGTQWSGQQIAGYLAGGYLTDRVLGSIQGEVLGSYDTFAPGLWEAAALGTFEEQPLVMGGEINGGYHYYDDAAGEVAGAYGYLAGLFGTVASPFTAGAELYLMGEATPYGQTTWWGDLSNIYTPDGAALPVGLIAGRTTAHYDYTLGRYLRNQEALEGLFLSLYVDSAGNGGILKGDFEGDFYPLADNIGDNNWGLFRAGGFLQATPKAAGFDPLTTTYNYSPIEGAYAGSLGAGLGSITAAAAGGLQDSSWGYLGSYSYWLEKDGVPEPWGIFNLELGGVYQLAAGAGAPETWVLSLGGSSLRGLEANEYWLAATDGTWVETDGDKRLAADLIGHYLTPTTLGVLNGQVLGSFDTNGQPGNWEAIALGTFENTQPLAFSAEINAAYHQYENSSVNYYTDSLGYLGTIDSPFAAAVELNVPGEPVDLYMMGQAWPEGRTAWWGSLYETQLASGDILPDGFIVGRTTAGKAGGDTLTGSLVSLYIDEAGSAGILEGFFDGLYHPLGNGSGVFEATPGASFAWATKKAEGYANYDPLVNLGWNYLDGNFGGSFLDGDLQPLGAIVANGSIADISWGWTGSYTTWLQQSAAQPEPWGIFALELGGQYMGTPADTWTMKLGGTSWRALGSREYWLAEVYGMQWSEQQFAGYLDGAYLTDSVLGIIQGEVLGSYDTFTPGVWEAAAIGTFEEQPLALGGEINGGYHYYDGAAGEVTGNYGYLAGLFGTLDSPFTADAELYLMGEAAPYGQTTWWGDLSNIYTADGGALPVGLMAGRTTAHYDYTLGRYLRNQESLEGLFLSLYVDSAGNAGIMEGDFEGDFYPLENSLGDNNGGLFLSTGFLQATPKAAGFDPLTTTYNYSPIEGAYAGSLGAGLGSITAAAAGGLQDSSWGYLGSYSYWLEKDGVPEPWGIFNLELGGVYQLAAGAGAPETWSLRLGGSSLRGLAANEYWLAATAGTWVETDGDKRLAAALTGHYLTPTTLGVLNGQVLGSFDTNGQPGNWEAIALGTFADTEPLAFSAEINAGYNQYENNMVNFTDMALGLLGTTASPFAAATTLNAPGTPVELYLMGEAWPGGQTAWWGSLYDTQAASGDILPDGFILGRTTAGNAAGEMLTGSLVSLYIDEAGNAGILEGFFDGLYHPMGNGSGIFETTSGAAWATKKAEGYTSYDPLVNLGYNYLDGTFSGSFLDGDYQPTGAIIADDTIANISWGKTGSYTTWLQQSAAAPEPWGIFNIELGGQYLGTPADAWTMQLGGASFRALGSREYWLAEVYGMQWSEQQIAGYLAGAYLTERVLGSIQGDVLGSYDTFAPGLWEGAAIGTFAEQPLTFVSDLASDDGLVSALLGGTESLWTNTEALALTMGAWNGGSGVWSMPVWSDNFADGSVTTYDGGAYRGFSYLVADDEQEAAIGLIALYIDPNGQTGYLQGELSGAAYPDLGLYAAEGLLARTEIEAAPAGMTAVNFDVTVNGPQSLTVAGAPGTPDFISETREEAWIAGQNSWGIWQSLLEGSGASGPASWQWETALGTDVSYWTGYHDMTWTNNSANVLAGTVAGAKADWVNAATYVAGGEIKGLFNPATASWKALAQGAWVETGKFLEMTTSNPSALQAMNIPAIQVGSATLSQGAGTVNNLSNVTLDNVRFFATSTGSVPKIWATNAVSGNFGAAPVVGGAAVPLAGGGLNANFAIGNWNTAAGAWGANVTGGTGTLSNGSYNGPVQFQGGAAGQIGAGTFTGTGAGVVK